MSLKLNNQFRRTLRKVKQPHTGWLDVFPAVIGKSDGTIQTGIPGEIYVRNTVNGQVVVVHNNGNVPSIANLQVEVGRRVDKPSIWQIKGQLETYNVPSGGDILVGYHADQHRFPEADTVWVDRKQITHFTVLVSDAANFIVQVFGGVASTPDGVILLENQTVDLSSYVPTSGAKYVSLVVEQDGTLTVLDGTEFESRELAAVTDIPAPGTDQFLLAFALLYEQQTELENSDIRVVEIFGGAGGGTVEYLDDLLDVEVPAPNDGEVLTFDVYSQTWFAAPSGGSVQADWSQNDSGEPDYILNRPYRLKQPCQFETDAPLINSPTYDNGASGIGATLTGGSDGALTLSSGTFVPELGDRILVRLEHHTGSNMAHGIYILTQTGDGSSPYILTRSEDFDEGAEIMQSMIPVVRTMDGGPKFWFCTNIASPTVGSTTIAISLLAVTGQAGGELNGTYPSPTLNNYAVITKVLSGFSAGAGTVSASDSILTAIQKIVGNIALKLTANSLITGATKTKITYDANGLVTSGADATLADLAGATEDIQDIIGGMVSGNVETGISVTYDDTGGKLDFVVSAASADGWQAVAETWTYASADDPVYQIYVSGDVTGNENYKLGNKIKCTNNSTTFYGFIVKVGSYDGGNNRTPVDIYGGTDYDLANSAITAPYISKIKSPDGFPLSPDKWTVITTDTTDRNQVTSGTTVYNLGSVSISAPIGLWRVRFACLMQIGDASHTASAKYLYVSLSTANNTINNAMAASIAGADIKLTRSAIFANFLPLALTAKTSYYLTFRSNGGGGETIYSLNNASTLYITLECAYL